MSTNFKNLDKRICQNMLNLFKKIYDFGEDFGKCFGQNLKNLTIIFFTVD